MRDRYRRVHGFYDILCTVFSLGAIDRCRAASVAGAGPGERILLAGCGSAPEAAAALDAGALVTLVDRSPAMLRRARRRLAGSGARFVEEDLRGFRDRCVADGTAYDRVVANFLLNVFDEPEAREVLAALRDLVTPGGRLFVGDFAPPAGSRGARVVQAAYWWTASVPFSLLTGDARHPVHDYAAGAEDAGLAVKGIAGFPLLGAVAGFRTVEAVREPPFPPPSAGPSPPTASHCRHP